MFAPKISFVAANFLLLSFFLSFSSNFNMTIMAWHGMAWHFVGNSIVAHCFLCFARRTWFEIIKLQTIYYSVHLCQQTKRQSVRIALVYLLVYKHKFTSCYDRILCTFFFYSLLFFFYFYFARSQFSCSCSCSCRQQATASLYST